MPMTSAASRARVPLSKIHDHIARDAAAFLAGLLTNDVVVQLLLFKPEPREGRCAAWFRAERGSARCVHITRDDIDNLKQRFQDSESRLRSWQADWGPNHCRVAAATTTLPSKRRNEPSSEEMSDCCIPVKMVSPRPRPPS
jgi:hypothetical protein